MISAELAEQKARQFLGETPVVFHSKKQEVLYRDRWTPVYKFQGTHYVVVDAESGHIISCLWWSARRESKRSNRPPRSVTQEEAATVARKFAVAHYPGFQDSLKCSVRYEQFLEAYTVAFLLFEAPDLHPACGPFVDISTKTGEVISYRADFPSLKIRAKPSIGTTDAERIIRSLFDMQVQRVDLKLWVEMDSIGEQLLQYDAQVEGTALTTDANGSRGEEKVTDGVAISAITGRYDDMPGYGDVPERPKPPWLRTRLKKLPPETVRVDFDGAQVGLLTPPLLRNDKTLISKELFEALGGKVTWDKATGKIVLERGTDPVVLTVGKTQGTRDGASISVESAPEVIGDDRQNPPEDRLFLPSSLIHRVLGMEVRWNKDKMTLFINSKRPEREKDQPPK